MCKDAKTKAQLISAFVFATKEVQFFYFRNPKCQTSSYLLWLYRPVCVEPGSKPKYRISHDAAHLQSKTVFLVLLTHVRLHCATYRVCLSKFLIQYYHQKKTTQYYCDLPRKIASLGFLQDLRSCGLSNTK